MDDSISRQAAIEQVDKDIWDDIVAHDVKETLKELPSAEITEEQAIDKLHETGWMQNHDKEMTNSRWIPCSERLPDEDKDVLITYQYKEGEGDRSHSYIDITTYGDAYFGGRKCSFKEWRQPFEYFHANYEVIAWLPLPDPYEVEDD